MPSDELNQPESPQIKSDDEWKERVKAEDAARDQPSPSESPEEGPGGGAAPEEESAPPEAAPQGETAGAQETPPSFPPAEFATLVGMLSTQAMVALGVIPNPATGKAEPYLDLARHFIDLLGVVEDKSRGNLDEHEARMIESTLHELRMAYIEQKRAAASKEPTS